MDIAAIAITLAPELVRSKERLRCRSAARVMVAMLARTPVCKETALRSVRHKLELVSCLS